MFILVTLGTCGAECDFLYLTPEVVNLDSGMDYRTLGLDGARRVYFVSSQCDAETEANTIFKVSHTYWIY